MGNKAEKLELIVPQCIQAIRLDTKSNQKKISPLSLTSNVLFTTSSKVCVMQSVLDIHADTSVGT